MKWATRALLLAAFVLAVVATTRTASAAPFDSKSTHGTFAIVPPAGPDLVPNAQGCSGTPNIQYAYANPPTIAPGQITTLYWGLVGNANAAYLQYPNNSRVGIGTPGSQQVNPTITSTYYIIGVCGGNQAQFPITVNVQGGPTCNGSPQITLFSANPTTVQAGQTSTLNWGPVNNATAVSLSTPNGNSGVATPGSVNVNPNQTTTYTLTAWCNNNSVQAQVTVNVSNPPPPPPPVSGDRITGISYNGGLSNSSRMVMTVNYFWNGQDAPAVLHGRAYNGSGQQVGQSNATRIDPQRDFYANLNFPVNPANVTRVNICMIGSSGTELVCQNGSK